MAQQPFLKNTKILKTKLNNANFVDKYGIYIPNHANLSLKDLKYVVTHFNSIAEPKHF